MNNGTMTQREKSIAGIVSTGIYIPDCFHSAQYISEQSGVPKEIIETKIGFTRKNVPCEGDHTVSMGIRAARKAMEKGGIEPEEIDLVLWTGEEHKEYRIWSAGLKVQKELGLTRAWSCDFQQRCGTTVVGMKLARDIIRSDGNIGTILIASGYRNSDLIDYANPRTRFMYYLAAGGAACIVRRNHPFNVILEGGFMSDGSFADDVYVPAGGSAMPMTHEALDKGLQYLDVFDPEGMKLRLEQKSLDNWLQCMEMALKRSGYGRNDLDYLGILLIKRSAHNYLIEHLGLSPEQTRYLREFGHHGQNDQILSIELGLKEGRIKDGDLLMLVSAGIGYAWDAILVRWGPVNAPSKAPRDRG